MPFDYFERTATGVLGEPLNTITNAAFFVAAWAGLRLARKRQALDSGTRALLVLLVAIGIGSSLFHMFANNWTRWMDIVPILLFQMLAVWLYVRRIMDGSRSAALLALVFLIASSSLVAISPHALNGSLMYAGAWLSLVLLGIYHRWRNRPEPWLMLLAAGVFTLSLFFRSMDKSVFVRSHFSHGVHFLWHVFNGVTLYLVFRALIPVRSTTPQKPTTGF